MELKQYLIHTVDRDYIIYILLMYVSEFQIFQLKNHQSTKHFHGKVINVTMWHCDTL